ncbi:hypothetical protein QF044_001572 [Chryseobacterium sp. W4I1]|nr:hypothetical protein [Chryseobacterium sp. W4I1]
MKTAHSAVFFFELNFLKSIVDKARLDIDLK